MLSTMTTSENFSLSSQSPYRSHSFGGSTVREDCAGNFLLESNFPSYGHSAERDETLGNFEVTPGMICNSIGVSGGGVVSTEVPKIELESDISELLEQLELEEIPYDNQSKPIKIDPSLLNFNFGKFSDANQSGNYKSLDDFCSKIARENQRASHHLSGGGLLTEGDQWELFQNSKESTSKSGLCTLWDGGCAPAENIFDFNDLSCFESDAGSNFLNQISPSSPLKFDLVSQKTEVTKGESTNPFNNFIKDVLDRENGLSSTNPFADLAYRSSLESQPSKTPPEYENLILPQKSFSQCSTRPASPVSKPEEPCISNPFLLNRASPQTLNLNQFFLNEFPSQPPAQITNPSSSFIFAVPVFPIFQHHIANSSTQTSEPPRVQPQEPVYQNVTNQLKKFMQRNNHSEYDLQCLKTTMKDLRSSGWYYENVSWQESVVLLKNTEPGTFMIRDSSDPNFLFSLSVQTSRGPTSVRLHYVNGQFRLDAEEKLIPHMPSFNSVIELIDYYIENTVKNKLNGIRKSNKKNGREKLHKSKEQVWIDAQGNVYSNILLVKPLYKKDHFSTLQHLTRLAINRHLKMNLNRKNKLNFRVTPVYESSPFQDSSFPITFDNMCPIMNVDSLPLPVTLVNYLKDYPYCH